MLVSTYSCMVLLVITTLLYHTGVEGAKFLPNELDGFIRSNNYPTIVVDQSGQGNFKTAQAVPDSMKINNNNNWIRYPIKGGTYKQNTQFYFPTNELVGLGKSMAIASDNYPTIVVDQSGQGHFKTIQAAIDSIKINNDHWIRVNIKAGTYKESVTIPETKPFILLQGEGSKTTQIVASYYQNINLATFNSIANNVVAMNIAFINSYNYPEGVNKNKMLQAVAARIEGDRTAFYNCVFRGVQDTLWDATGRHYFYNCEITGAVDFIFGNANSIYKQCSLNVLPVLDHAVPGYITAQGREHNTEATGFLFNQCTIAGSPAYLGRAWKPFAKVIFMYSTFNNYIPPQGWDIWNWAGLEKQVTFAEYQCSGPGANTAGRVKWEQTITPAMVAQFEDSNGASSWLKSQPQP